MEMLIVSIHLGPICKFLPSRAIFITIQGAHAMTDTRATASAANQHVQIVVPGRNALSKTTSPPVSVKKDTKGIRMWRAKMSMSAKLLKMTAGLLTTNVSIYPGVICVRVLTAMLGMRSQVRVIGRFLFQILKN